MDTARTAVPARPHQLTAGWRYAVAAGWALIFLAFVGVLVTSQRIGLSTWWLGPSGQSSPLLTIIPFVAPATMVVLAFNNVRFLPFLGLLAAAVTAVVGALDLDHVRRLAAIELLLAASGAALSVASLAGSLKPPRPLND